MIRCKEKENVLLGCREHAEREGREEGTYAPFPKCTVKYVFGGVRRERMVGNAYFLPDRLQSAFSPDFDSQEAGQKLEVEV